MAKTKKELLEEAQALGIEIDAKAKVAEVQAAIEQAQTSTSAEETPESTDEPHVAKAGKRSAKALAEADEKAAKEARKASSETEEAKPKQPVKPTRSRLERRGKGFRKHAEQIEKGKLYGLSEAVQLAQKTSHVSFDATVELHINLGVDPRHADQNLRDNLVLPAGTGKTIKIAVFTDNAAEAKEADIAGTEDVLALLDKGTLDFDVLIATPALMPKLGKYARVLGPRGLMPNPKSGTVTNDVAKAIAEAKAGKVEYRVDSNGIVHLGVGKVSFSLDQLLSNIQAVMTSIKANKPQSVKGTYIKSVYLTTSMGPSVAVDSASV